MIEELTIFLVIGLIQLAAFKGAHNVSRLPPEFQTAWALNDTGQIIIYLLFAISGLSYVFTLVYGFAHLQWWIPLLCAILVFPFAYYLFIRPITGDIFAMAIGGFLSIIGAGLIGFNWLA